ncbi:thiamine pyrophosphate-dependent enzyme [Desulfobacula sp.]|uniref:thiamine pyrophosphate-dependent enzyme n=1 Tax=Desulfobacula sp. TaxID=2593537 RepID=UPI00261D6149|nr:thiamine pyrophosphate-dependent enzyme [Desulfobacula sp.]
METMQIKDEMFYPGSFSCPGCGLTMAYRHVTKVLGKNTVVVTTAGCGSVVAGYYPTTTSKLPFFHCSFGTTAATASGLKAGLDMMGKTNTHVLAWAGDGGTFDIGLQSLSGAAERNDDIIYVCYDNEAYMNTGVQRSSATPLGTLTTTTPPPALENRDKKDIIGIMAAHKIPYMATACVSYPMDLQEKIRKAKKTKGFKFIHVLIPCPTGWFFPAKDAVTVGRLAVLSRAFPLFEVIDGKEYRMNVFEEKIPVAQYLTAQGRFRQMSTDLYPRIQTDIDSRWSELMALSNKREESTS